MERNLNRLSLSGLMRVRMCFGRLKNKETFIYKSEVGGELVKARTIE